MLCSKIHPQSYLCRLKAIELCASIYVRSGLIFSIWYSTIFGIMTNDQLDLSYIHACGNHTAARSCPSSMCIEFGDGWLMADPHIRFCFFVVLFFTSIANINSDSYQHSMAKPPSWCMSLGVSRKRNKKPKAKKKINAHCWSWPATNTCWFYITHTDIRLRSIRRQKRRWGLSARLSGHTS